MANLPLGPVHAAGQRPADDLIGERLAHGVLTADGGKRGLGVEEVPDEEPVAVLAADVQALVGEPPGFLPLPGVEIVHAQVDQAAEVAAGRAALAPLGDDLPGGRPDTAQAVNEQ